MKILLILMLLLVAERETKPILPCWKAIVYVSLYGQVAVESWARSNGYSEAEIAAIHRRCFKAQS